jgi:hypothetical protein
MKKLLQITVASLAGFLATALTSSAERIYVNVGAGNDANPGTKSQPLKGLQEAAKRANANNQQEATTILLSEGVYPLTETVLFNNPR